MNSKKLPVIIAMLFSLSNQAASWHVKPNDTPLLFTHQIPNNTFHQFCKNVHSQGGEDGILEQLVKELNIKNGTFCEFGAANGTHLSNTYNLIKTKNFSGIAIELDYSRYVECVKNYTAFPKVTVFHGAVLYNDPNNDLDAWLHRGKMPYDFDILSIDIDCDDYYVWKNLKNFQPKIVVIEINPYRDPIHEELPRIPSQEYEIDPLRQWHPQRVAVGCSFISAVKLGLEKGYIPIAFTGNLIFIRKDLIPRLNEFPCIDSNNPYDFISLYSHFVLLSDNKWHTNTGLILNAAIRDCYLQFKEKMIDIRWINKRMQEIMNNDI